MGGRGQANVPDAPTIGTATAGDKQATVTFTPPAYDGGSPIISYTVTSSPGGITASGASSPITVTGLTNGTAYTFTVAATNAVGTGASSAASNSVTPVGVPAAPTIGTATQISDTQATITFTPPTNDGGAPITLYTVTSSPGGITATGSGSPITIGGLTNGVTYTFNVTATNIYGVGPASGLTSPLQMLPWGEQAYSVGGTYTWVAPAGVTSVNVVAIGGGGLGFPGGGGGGGGLGWRNSISVVPGNSYTVVVGRGGKYASGINNGEDSYFINSTTVKGGGGLSPGQAGLRTGGTYVGSGGGNGGDGGAMQEGAEGYGGGGGGAGGYTGTGGAGGYGPFTGAPAAGPGNGGGGGGGGGGDGHGGAGGGGVGLYGQGANGAAGYNLSYTSIGGGGGSGGSAGNNFNNTARAYGGIYGGGGGNSGEISGTTNGGGTGAVRIVWPATRTFPNNAA